MKRLNAKYLQLYVIVRLDTFGDSPQERITTTKVVTSDQEAQAEVDRLNALVESRGVSGAHYFWQMAHFDPLDIEKLIELREEHQAYWLTESSSGDGEHGNNDD